MPTMPSGLVPTVAAYSSEAPGGVNRTEVAGGHSRTRLTWSRGRQRYSVEMVLDKSEMSVWTAFYYRIIKKGAIAFDMRLDTGLGVAAHSVNIVPGTYQASAQSGNFRVAFTVECESAVYTLTDAEVAAYGLSADAMPAGFVPVVAQYSHDDPGGVARDAEEGGWAGYALERDRTTQPFNCTLMLTRDEFEIWTVWFHRLILKGVRTFTMRLDSGFGTEDHTATIIPGSYSETRTGGTITVVSFAVDAESKAYDLTAGQAQAMVDLHNEYGRSSDDVLAQIAQFATVDTNVLVA